MEAAEDYVLFEFLDMTTVSFRRSDMDYPDVRRQFLELIHLFLRVKMTSDEWSATLIRVPGEWGDFLGFGVGDHDDGRSAAIFKADREPGVNSGENALITSIERTAKQ